MTRKIRDKMSTPKAKIVNCKARLLAAETAASQRHQRGLCNAQPHSRNKTWENISHTQRMSCLLRWVERCLMVKHIFTRGVNRAPPSPVGENKSCNFSKASCQQITKVLKYACPLTLSLYPGGSGSQAGAVLSPRGT